MTYFFVRVIQVFPWVRVSTILIDKPYNKVWEVGLEVGVRIRLLVSSSSNSNREEEVVVGTISLSSRFRLG